jgi:DNA modification methylase
MSDYTLYHADCLDILPTLEAQSIDAVICDVPSGRTACHWDKIIPFDRMWPALQRVIKPRGAIVLLGCTQPFTSALIMSNVKQYHEEIVWEKSNATGFLDVRRKHLKAHENIIVFADGEPCYTPQKTNDPANRVRKIRRVSKDTPRVYGKFQHHEYREYDTTRYPRSVQRFAHDARNNQFVQRTKHPTQKPIALLEYLIRTYTNAGDTVLDFAMGSGTAGAACANLGRRFIGIEKDAHYFEVAQERIADAYAPLRHMQQAGGAA